MTVSIFSRGKYFGAPVALVCSLRPYVVMLDVGRSVIRYVVHAWVGLLATHRSLLIISCNSSHHFFHIFR